MIDTAPNTKNPPVNAVATVVRLLGTFTWPEPDGQPVPATVARARITVIDFYPATTNHQPEGEDRAI